ncbi:MAG: DNA-binding transcriptional dual regulator/DNA repair protein Ada [Sodalis sp. Psp]|nr:DNA-binding transcriptional dual regulator/DNA repair protein Ada [Sodalis sp. Psp]MCR3757190.1 DNA-binding transcriptional dual regulator/DNA repair protein Ada [Sodalis sp. Ppy]
MESPSANLVGCFCYRLVRRGVRKKNITGPATGFISEAKVHLKMTFSTHHVGSVDIQIQYVIGRCSLGVILVARSSRGICAIMLGDDVSQLLRELQEKFLHAELMCDVTDYQQLLAQVVSFVDAPQSSFNLPLDICGTVFQKKVWQVLRTIASGQTMSYRQVAEHVSAPRAVRAVANACGSNLLAVAIPCHRVVYADGTLSGYRWGIERKRQLLKKEADD